MPTQDFIQLPSFNGVAAGSTATLDLSNFGGAFHALQLTYTTATAGGADLANMTAELTEFRLKVNGNVQRTFSFAQLAAINALRGVAFATGIADIIFAPGWTRSAAGEDALAWGMADVQTFQLEVDIAAGATTPTLTARAAWMDVTRPMGQIVKWKRFTVPVVGAGVVTWSQFPRGDAYYGVHGFSANITAERVLLNQREKFNATTAQAAAWYATHGVTMQANVFSQLFNPNNRVSDALPTRDAQGNLVNELRYEFTMGAAGSFTALTETLGVRD
jgi:hypothetical protein